MRHSLPGLLATLLVALVGGANSVAAGIRSLLLVSASLVREGLTLAQESCAAKGNEIKAFPRLLERMALEGAVVTIDAAGCQTAIVRYLRAAGANYLLAVKRNQPALHWDVMATFTEVERGVGLPEAVDRWPGLRSLIRVHTEHRGSRGRRQHSVRHYNSSLPVDAETLLALVRGHWAVENDLHRPLNMQFQEDACRMCNGHGPAVMGMGILRRTTLNMLRTLQHNISADVSIGLLRDRIGRRPWSLASALP